MDGRPLASYQVRLRSPTDSFYMEGDPDQNGTFSFNQLPAGEYTLEMLDERRVLRKETITVEAGQTRELAFAVSAAQDHK